MKLRVAVIGLVLLLAAAGLSASGPIGFYGLIEKVGIEPNETSPQALQVWGRLRTSRAPPAGPGFLRPGAGTSIFGSRMSRGISGR